MEILSHSANETLELGKFLAKNLEAGDIVCLLGNLGSGKTVFCKGIAQGLGIKGKEIISPSFVLIRQYSGARLPLYHFDLYRLTKEKDILALGYEEYFYGAGVAVIEWAERLHSIFPKESLKVHLTVTGKNLRRINFSAQGRRYRELLKILKSKNK